MNSRLAIIIPYYKLTFFRETLESLAAQSDKRFHVYIGDDASPEDPTDLLREFEGKFNFTYKKFDNNLGGTSLTQQWERCIEMMQGEEWFMVLGDDDFFSKSVVEKFYEYYDDFQGSANVLSYQYNKTDETNHLIQPFWIKEAEINPLQVYVNKILNKTMTSLSQFVFNKVQYCKYKFTNLPLAWGSDDLAYILFCENKNIYVVPENVYVRYSKINISGDKKYFKQKHLAILEFYETLFKLNGKNIKGKLKDIIFNEYFTKLLTFDGTLPIIRYLKFLHIAMRYDIKNLSVYIKSLIAFFIR